MDNLKITPQNICGKWNSSEFGDFIIFGYCDKYFISFHEKYRWGKKIGEIKYFIYYVGNGQFYFGKKNQFYEIWYNKGNDTITLKLCDICNKTE